MAAGTKECFSVRLSDFALRFAALLHILHKPHEAYFSLNRSAFKIITLVIKSWDLHVTLGLISAISKFREISDLSNG